MLLQVAGFEDSIGLRSVLHTREQMCPPSPEAAAVIVRKSTRTPSYGASRACHRGSSPGEHTVVSRVTDINGTVQPTSEELEVKKTFLEDNSQHPRHIMVE